MRQMSQIFATAFEYMFDGRRTKIEKLNGEVGMPGMGDKSACCVTCRMWDGCKNEVHEVRHVFAVFYKAEKGEKWAEININFDFV